MLVQEKKIRGFSLLEIVVTLVLVGIISAMAYNPISNWNKQREVDNSAVKIKTFFTNINAQVQRGLYGFVQIYVSSTADKITFASRGMNTSTLAQKINTDSNFSKIEERCNIDGDYWDDDGLVDRKPEVSKLEVDNVKTTFLGEAAVCFSKDGRWFSAKDNFIFGTEAVYGMFICEETAGACTDNQGEIKSGVKYLYNVNWTRFGNINLEKYDENKETWIAR